MRKFLEIPRKNFCQARGTASLAIAGAFGSNTFRGRANTLRGWSIALTALQAARPKRGRRALSVVGVVGMQTDPESTPRKAGLCGVYAGVVTPRAPALG